MKRLLITDRAMRRWSDLARLDGRTVPQTVADAALIRLGMAVQRHPWGVAVPRALRWRLVNRETRLFQPHVTTFFAAMTDVLHRRLRRWVARLGGTPGGISRLADQTWQASWFNHQGRYRVVKARTASELGRLLS